MLCQLLRNDQHGVLSTVEATPELDSCLLADNGAGCQPVTADDLCPQVLLLSVVLVGMARSRHAPWPGSKWGYSSVMDLSPCLCDVQFATVLQREYVQGPVPLEVGTLQSCEILWVEGAAVSLTDGASTSFIDCEMGTGRVKHRLLDGISSGAKGIVALNRAGGSFHRCHLNNHSESAVEVCISSCLLLKLILVYDTPRSRLRELDVLYGFVCVGLSSCGWCTDWQWRGSFLQ